MSLRDQLEAHSSEFRKEIIEVAEGIHVAVGYDGSNASMIVGDDGVVFVDTLRATESAHELVPLFREISSKPVKAIIYTHGHGDHTGGASVFAGDDRAGCIPTDQFFPGTPQRVAGEPDGRGTGHPAVWTGHTGRRNIEPGRGSG